MTVPQNATFLSSRQEIQFLTHGSLILCALCFLACIFWSWDWNDNKSQCISAEEGGWKFTPVCLCKQCKIRCFKMKYIYVEASSVRVIWACLNNSIPSYLSTLAWIRKSNRRWEMIIVVLRCRSIQKRCNFLSKPVFPVSFFVCTRRLIHFFSLRISWLNFRSHSRQKDICSDIIDLCFREKRKGKYFGTFFFFSQSWLAKISSTLCCRMDESIRANFLRSRLLLFLSLHK